ncbi:MAG: formylglycine-generating enzyme family protein [Fibromonadales bacterium]|nr:formylglycine-generating enzyme family protein [Fibromonadales bacterium]
MRIFVICAVFCSSALLAAGERATLNIFTSPDSSSIFLDGNPEKEISGSPFENPAMLTGEHTVFLIPPNESFVPATYDFILHNGRVFEINHDFLRRNQVREAYSLSPSEYHIEANAGFLYFNEFGSNAIYKTPFDFRLGLPLGFGARLAFPVQEWEIRDFLLGMQYNYFPLQIGIALDWISPRGSGFSAIRTAILAEQNVLFLNLLENLVYEYSKQEKAEFYLRVGMPVKHIFLPYLAVREKIHLPLKSHIFYAEPGALLQVSNGFSLEASIPIAILGNAKKGFGFYFGLHSDFSFGKESKRDVHKTSKIIWDVNEVSNGEYKKFCEETGREIPAKAKIKELEDYPVLHINLKDAIAYANWKKKRLPTAEEWKTLASTYSNFDSFCEVRKLKKVYEGPIINGIRNFAGNAAIWLLPENENASVASFAGSSYEDSFDTCKKKAVLTDLSSPSGNEFIGIRLVRDY